MATVQTKKMTAAEFADKYADSAIRAELIHGPVRRLGL